MRGAVKVGDVGLRYANPTYVSKLLAGVFSGGFWPAVMPPWQHSAQAEHFSGLQAVQAVAWQSAQGALPMAALQFVEQSCNRRRGQF